MSNLAKIDPRAVATKTSELCSPALWSRLTDARLGWAEAAEIIASDPEALGELQRVSGAMERAMEPCGGQVVIEALAPMLALFNVPRKTEAEAATFWGFYIDALGSLPAEAVRAGVADFVADPKAEWFPKPGPLKALCEKRAEKLRIALGRTRKAIQIASAA